MKKEIQLVISSLLIKAFYQQHSIVLGIVYLVMFGAVEGSQLAEYHLKLIEGTFSHNSAFLLILTIWWLYFLRVLYFLVQVIANKQNFLLQQLNLLQPFLFKAILLGIIAICLLPISTYAIAMLVWGIVHGFYYKVAGILVFYIVLQCGGLFFLKRKLNDYDFKFGGKTDFGLGFTIPVKFPFQIFLKYIRNEQKMQWLVLKLIMVFCIGMNFSEALPQDELRFAIFFYAMLLLIHTNLVRQFIIWEKTAFWHLQMLPFGSFKKWINYLFFFMVLLLPEIILVAKTFPNHLNFQNMIGIMLLSIGLLMFIYAVCIAFDNNVTETGPVIFLALLLTYIACLAESIITFSITLLLSSYLIYNKTIAGFELQYNKEQQSES